MASSSKQPLALDFHAHGQAWGWRKGEDLIDALPYVDTYEGNVKQQVDALIEEEMSKSTKKPADYLREMPAMPPSTLKDHPLLVAEMERIKKREPLPPLDTSRYRLDPPPQSRRHDPSAWKSAVDNAAAQLEHQTNRILNLELMLKYGDNVWRAQALSDEAGVKRVEAQLAETKKAIDALNKERKLQQQAAGSELRRAEAEYYELVYKNIAIESACDRLEEEIAGLKAQLPPQEQQQQQGAAAAEGHANGQMPADAATSS
mmetsp:Transcript_19379/g.41933  ORF Transcript_19379/g.41933 Transcript_19379/m.41933 type:complete len:260 (+) Transcript_19379:104-883(+)|eukprot:CAMPEP_0202890074 /NCGR_PEP_ID=MMETSP1392-20130828/589_1 /ASSEMBLY_ACC=CAM_ASM_000868 /TAXON_ID=225041 /ORGANISM="Chlamydomonas chlamydogama, Strain SAG 11-48b" /LENGTH=259 /DNA_ID=CAMNT_0049573563 /DNA_START=200 /DNA_END=979 /DNA_ORIENTATION=+